MKPRRRYKKKVISNSDIFWSESLRFVRLLKNEGDEVFALSRHDMIPEYPLSHDGCPRDTMMTRNHCLSYTGSHDGFAFRVPIRIHKVRRGELEMSCGRGVYMVGQTCASCFVFIRKCPYRTHFTARVRSSCDYVLSSFLQTLTLSKESFDISPPFSPCLVTQKIVHAQTNAQLPGTHVQLRNTSRTLECRAYFHSSFACQRLLCEEPLHRH